MGAKGTSHVNLRRSPQGFMNILSSAACEWLLIILLFVDAVFWYLLTKFARCCELQTPCLLCSRLDHVFGNEKPDFYWSLLCSNHRVELSSLVSCNIHNKLADICGMCDECLMSFTTQNKSSSESYRLLMGMFGADFDLCGFQNPYLNKNHIPGLLSTKSCSCCNKLQRTRSNDNRLIQQTPTGFGASKANTKPPLPRMLSRSGLCRRDGLKKIIDKFSCPVTSQHLGNTGIDALSYVGYTELKPIPDSDSEVPFSDDDDGNSVVHEKVGPKEDLVVQCKSGIWTKTRINNLASAKQAQEVSNPEPSLLDQYVQLDVSEPHDVHSLASDVMEHGLGELNWEQINPKPNLPVLPELISLEGVPPSSNVAQIPADLSAYKSDIPLSQESNLSARAELISPDGAPPSSNSVEIPFIEKLVDVIGTSDIRAHASLTKNAELSESISTTNGAGFDGDQVPNDTTPTASGVDQTDISKLTICDKERDAYTHVDQLFFGSEEVQQDKKSSQHVSVHGIDLSLSNTSSRVFDHQEELERNDISLSDGLPLLEEPVSLERNNSSCESVDGSSVSEIEGESLVDRLKRQVEYDRRCMSDLYKELEEERSASAVAANQAMAMITRLQEEKAALHMEALQYLRMMEEQAEYDMEALQKANDLLAEKEKEVQDLEAELEFCRSMLDESMVLHDETDDSKGEKMMVENNSLPCFESNAYIPTKSMSSGISVSIDESINAKTSFLDFEEEKYYISECLKKLERKLNQVSSNGAPSNMVSSGYSESAANGISNQEEFHGGALLDHQKEDSSLSTRRELSALDVGALAQEASVASVENDDCVKKDNNACGSDQKILSMAKRQIDLVFLENEISDMNDRLDALEADSDFLEHAINTLQNGNEGLQLVRELVHQLRELRKNVIKERNPSVP